jgi:hypothetical protein
VEAIEQRLQSLPGSQVCEATRRMDDFEQDPLASHLAHPVQLIASSEGKDTAGGFVEGLVEHKPLAESMKPCGPVDLARFVLDHIYFCVYIYIYIYRSPLSQPGISPELGFPMQQMTPPTFQPFCAIAGRFADSR